MESHNPPNYKIIYTDILKKKFPYKEKECESLMNKENLAAHDIIKLNEKIFGKTSNTSEKLNRKLLSYSKSDILKCWTIRKNTTLIIASLPGTLNLAGTALLNGKKVFWYNDLTVNTIASSINPLPTL